MSQRGFSTVELMVVLAIVGILAAFAAPNLSRWSIGMRLNASTREIASELQLARMKAIAQNTSVTVCFYGPQADVQQYFEQTHDHGERYANGFFSSHLASTEWCDNPPAAGTPAFQQFVQTVKPLPSGMTVTPSDNDVTFNSRGAVVGVGRSIDLTPAGTAHTKSIKILSSTGRVRICVPGPDCL
ncbi:MAG: GspH/FimT family pseudopilin [Candidatus Tectimicrobiota bacterium]